VNIPTPELTEDEKARGDREANMQLAKADRQAVFKNDCRTCHVDKGVGKMGQELYAADCGICHDGEHRAAMVPDLRLPKAPRDYDYWVNWITYGRPGSMMPAFGEKDEGPLSKEQIDSLAKYLFENFPKEPVSVQTPAEVPPTAPKPGAGR
jgi:mono/diheme cytochrome c family protein